MKAIVNSEKSSTLSQKTWGVSEQVITMVEARYIKHLWEEEGKSLRDISRTTGLVPCKA